MNGKARRVTVAFVMLLATSLVSASPIVIKMANILPENTPWGRGLAKLSADWYKLSGGQIQLKLYQGTQGNTKSIRQKMDIGTLDAGVFDSTGLALIVPEILTLSTPNLIQNEAEMDAALAATRSIFEKRLDEKGYKVLAWSRGGWIYFFTRRSVTKPEELKVMKLAVSADEERIQQTFKFLGYRIVPTPLSTVVQALNTGAIDAFYGSPILLSSLWSSISKLTPYMVETPPAPVIGAMLIRKSSWVKIEEAIRGEPGLADKLDSAMKTFVRNLDSEVLKLEKQSIGEFKKLGLSVPPADSAARALWRDDFQRAIDSGLADAIDKPTFDAIAQAIGEVRKAPR